MDSPKIIAITGLNGSGKTLLTDRLRKQWASDSVRYVAFNDVYGTATDKAYYLQQRWNQHDIDAETPTAGQLLERACRLTGSDAAGQRQTMEGLCRLFGLDSLLDKYIISLSSGELRKFQLAKTLLSHPTTLILDNPFIGLDAPSRTLLRDLIQRLACEQGVTVYLVLARADEVPDYVDEIICTDHQPAGLPQPLEPGKAERLLSLPARDGDYGAETVIELNDVSISYGRRTILDHVSWTVRNGERWALLGENGSGKSTLLSLICADNPQSYACNISLFGRKRGSGESIWDIKRHIGYVSPEMHRSYQRAIPAVNVAASGLKDTVGLYVRPTEQEKEQCRWWLDLFGVGHLSDRIFTTLSSGEQRLVLLARAFVKDPELLILDEPLHGLDLHNRRMVRDIIDTFCRREGKTLIMVTHYEDELPQCIDRRKRLTKTQESL